MSVSSRLSIYGVTNRAPFPPEINLRTPVLFKLFRRADRRAALLFFGLLQRPPGFLFPPPVSVRPSRFPVGVFFFFFELSRVTTRFHCCCCYFLLLPLLLLLQLFWPCSSCLSIALLCRLSLSVVPSVLFQTLAFLPCLLSPISSLARFSVSNSSRCHGSPSSCQAIFPPLAHIAVTPDLFVSSRSPLNTR